MKSKAHSSHNGRSRTCEVNTIRVVEIDGNPWFVARDVYLVLFGRTTSINSAKALSSNEKRVLLKRGLSATDALTSLFTGTQYRLALVSESGLYKIIMRSNKPEAHAFQNWVTQVVLPSIHKDGG
ncbi:BRO-N domain-containing protein [Ruegeria atlantica]|uniref:BRO family protein n=1 Tax=Ruegeria atlantica TaxID=81569 RepID=A0ABX1WDV8_9RHOB|nr:BRO family protein [Ruegeria atlantica]